MGIRIGLLLLFLGGVMTGEIRATEMKEARLFYLNFGNLAAWLFKETVIPGIYAADPQSDITSSYSTWTTPTEMGKSLSPDAVRLSENLRSGLYLSYAWVVMPLGKTDQAVLFEAKGRVPPVNGAITFWFRGQAWDYTAAALDKIKGLPERVNFRTWDTNTPLRETFFEIRGSSSKLTFGKLEPGKLTLESADGARLSFPIDFDPALVHLVTINFKNNSAVILIDGEKKAEGRFVMPADVKEIVVGHVGQGNETWNRWLNDFAIWKRPLAISEIMTLWRKEGRIQLPLSSTIPFISHAPVIDGLMKPGEWETAAAVTGMNSVFTEWGAHSHYALGGDLSDLKDEIFLAYDSKNLYLAYHCPPPPEIAGNTPMIATMVNEADVFQVQIQYPEPGGDLYNLLVNRLNKVLGQLVDTTHSDYSLDFSVTGFLKESRLPGGPGFTSFAWNSKVTTASTLDMAGWHLEIAIPFDSFDIPTPKAGDTWSINFLRWWREVRSGIQSWAWGNRGPSEEGNERRDMPAGRIIFGKPGVIGRQQSIGEISRGKPHFVTELVNTDTKDHAVRCVVETNSGELQDEKTITVPANGRTTYEFAGRIVDYRTAVITLKIIDRETETPIVLAGYPVQRPAETDVYLRKYPSYDLVRYEVDFSNHAAYEPSRITALVTVCDQKGKEVWRKKYQKFKDYNFASEISTGNLACGNYTVTFLFTVGTRELEKISRPLEKKPRPEWYGNTLGFDGDDAPYPWSSIAVKENTVTVWGRTYDFGQTLFPQQVTTIGKPVLRAPMGIALESSEGRLSAEVKTEDIKWSKLSKARVEGTRRIKIGSLTLENTFWIEYDGLVWSTLRLIPEGKSEIKSLAFEIPFNQAFSDVINTCDYYMQNTGKLKPEGFVGAAQETWLGNATGGIQWTAETMGPYEVKVPSQCLRVNVAPEGGTIRVEFINIPTVLEKPREFSFGFVATPVRPKTLRTPEGERFRRAQLTIGNWQMSEPFWVPFPQKWVRKHEVKQGRMTVLPGIEERVVHHTTLGVMGSADEAMQEFGDEWLSNKNLRWRGKQVKGAWDNVSVTTASGSLQDYIVWRFNEFFKQDPVPGGYFDVSDPLFSSNPYAGAGYQREDGTRIPSRNLLGHRQVVKRLYNIQNAVFPGGGLWWHASGGPRMVFQSYCIGSYDGENFNGIISPDNPTYRTLLTPETYRAQYMGSNWGHWNKFLNQGRIPVETLRKYGFSELWDQLTGLQWLHDCFTRTEDLSRLSPLEGLLTRRDLVPMNRYNLFSPFNRFIPYWQQTITEPGRPEFYVSFYVKNPVKSLSGGLSSYSYYSSYDTGIDNIHQAVVVLYNRGTYEGPVRLKIDWKQLGFDDWEKVTAINAVHSTGFRVKDWGAPVKKAELYPKTDEYARIENGELLFPITQYNYRMIILQTPRPWEKP